MFSRFRREGLALAFSFQPAPAPCAPSLCWIARGSVERWPSPNWCPNLLGGQLTTLPIPARGAVVTDAAGTSCRDAARVPRRPPSGCCVVVAGAAKPASASSAGLPEAPVPARPVPRCDGGCSGVVWYPGKPNPCRQQARAGLVGAEPGRPVAAPSLAGFGCSGWWWSPHPWRGSKPV